jgi:hypothetical protein
MTMTKVVTYAMLAPASLEEADEIRNLLAAGDAETADVFEELARVSVDVLGSSRLSTGSWPTGRAITFTGPVAVELSVVMPCLNEVRTLEACIRKPPFPRGQLHIGGLSWLITEAPMAPWNLPQISASACCRSAARVGAALKCGIEAAQADG